jgi:hypothetical protein
MPLDIDAGELARASTLRDRLGVTAVLQADISLSVQETFTDCPGLVLSLDAWARYAIDGYVNYRSSTAAMIQFCFSAPLDSSGHSCFFPQRQGSAGGIGPLEGFRQVRFSDEFPQGAAGSGGLGGGGGLGLACMPLASIKTYRAGGGLQLRFAQIVSDASATTVLAGSWLRATKTHEYAPS